MKKATRHNSTRRSVSSRGKRGAERHRTEVSAGGLVFKRTRQGIYVAMMKDSYGKWAFPKGHVRRRQRESYQKAARREIAEELGLHDLKLHSSLGQIDIWFRDRFVFRGKLVHKFIHYFLFEAPARARLVKPQSKDKGEKIQAVIWVPIDQLEERSSYQDMRPVIKRALRQLRPSKRKSR